MANPTSPPEQAQPIGERTRRITRLGSAAGYAVAIAGVVGLASIGLSLTLGDPWGMVNDAALLVLTGAIAPLMLSFYELGGRTPLRLAQLAQTLGWLSVITWCVIQVLQMSGAVELAQDTPASGPVAVASLALVYIGLWISGANLLAGPWLPAVRWLGVVAGLAPVVFGIGVFLGGVDSGITALGGLGYLTLVPAWAFVMARLLGDRSRS